MSQKTIYTAVGLLHLIFGLGFILLPNLVTSLYGVSLDEAGTMMARLLGTSDLAGALLLLGARNLPASPATRLVSLKGMVEWGLVAIVLLYYSLTGLVNVLGWVSVVLFVIIVYLFAADAHRKSPA